MSRISISQGAAGARDSAGSALMMGVAMVSRMMRGMRSRHDARLLSELPDYLLKDIGIQRGMIVSAVQHGRGGE